MGRDSETSAWAEHTTRIPRHRSPASRGPDHPHAAPEALPEPLLTSPEVAEDVELAENVSIAMLAVRETLLPTERAVFVLREVFDVPYDEIRNPHKLAALGEVAQLRR